MRISALIPAYNCSSTIVSTIESVLQQTRQPDEILVMNDGSTDNTEEVLRTFSDKIRAYKQPNSGVAQARNNLLAHATGDLIAFLDADDLWHPQYLETQLKSVSRYPAALAYFARHLTFFDGNQADWKDVPNTEDQRIELIERDEFLPQYAAAPGLYCISFCCVPRRTFDLIGAEPFQLRVSEDLYFCIRLAFEGPVAYYSVPVGADRIRNESLSSNRILLHQGEVRAFELLEKQKPHLPRQLEAAFGAAFASKRRLYAKALMGVGRESEARQQILYSFCQSRYPLSLIKSAGLLCATYLPKNLQPKWSGSLRTCASPSPNHK